MAVDKRIFVSPGGGAWKGGMDKDSHERYVGQGYYRDARNVNFMVDGDRFVIKNLKGQTEIAYTLNSGQNMVIGSYEDPQANKAYALIWNSLGTHEVVEIDYTVRTKQVTQVTEGSGLGFEFNNLITGIELVNDRFLIWTDNTNEPVCLDLQNVPATITSANRYKIELAKTPDPIPVTVRYGTDQNRESNNLKKKAYKFRTRYVMQGGFRTHCSTISKSPVPEYAHMEYTGGDQIYFDNILYLTIEEAPVDVTEIDKIEILVQSGNSDEAMGDWYKLTEISADYFPQTVTFTGIEPLDAIDNTEVNIPYSFIPPTAKDVILLPSNVLAFANFSENIDADSLVPKVNIRSEEVSKPTSVTAATTTFSWNNDNLSIAGEYKNEQFDILIDTSPTYDRFEFTGTAQVGDHVTLDVTLLYTGTGPFVTPRTRIVTFDYVIKEDDIDGLSGSSALFAASKGLCHYMNSIDTRYYGATPSELDGFGGVVFFEGAATSTIVPNGFVAIQGQNQLGSDYSVSTVVSFVTATITSNYPNSSFPYQTFRTIKNYKSNSIHSFALQYEDEKGRRTPAIPVGKIQLSDHNSLSYDRIKFKIDHLAPENTSRYHILYGGNETYDRDGLVQMWTRATGDRNFIKVTISFNNIVRTEVEGVSGTAISQIAAGRSEITVYIDDAAGTGQSAVADEIERAINADPTVSQFIQATKVLTGVQYTVELEANNGSPLFDFAFTTEVEVPENSETTASVETTTLPDASNAQVDTISAGDIAVAFTEIIEATSGKERWGVNIFDVLRDHYLKAPNSGLEYEFVKGDRVRLKGYFLSGGSITYLGSVIDTEIKSADSENIYIEEDLLSISGGSVNPINLLIEIYRPKVNIEDNVYHEIGVTGGIDSDRYHLAPVTGRDTSQTGSNPALITLSDSGDSYYKFRSTIYASPSSEEFVEDFNTSDFFPSAVTDIGRPSVVDELGMSEVTRGSSIVYTQAFVNNTKINGLSIILPTSINDYDIKYGTIQKMMLRQNRELVTFFESKVGVIGVLSELALQQSGSVTYTTEALLNTINFYGYDGGIGTNPESLAIAGDVAYFVCHQNNAVCRVQPNTQIFEVSDYGMKSWFRDNLDVKEVFLDDAKFIGVYDERFKSYVLSLFAYVQPDSLTGTATTEIYLNQDDAALFPSADNIDVVVLKDNTGDYYVDRNFTLTGVSINQLLLDYDNSFPVGNDITNVYIRNRIATLVFNEEANGWVCFLDQRPEYMVRAGIDFISFYDGETWLNNNNSTRNSFFGSTVESTVDVVFNMEPQMMKQFQTIELEATSIWNSATDGDVSTLRGQSSLLEEGFYSEYQPGEYAAAFRQDTNTPNIGRPLLDGYDLRDRVITVKLRNSNTTEEELESATIQFFPSEASL